MKHSLKDWIIAARPWAFPASTMPALVAISYAFFVRNDMPFEINWWYGVLALVGAAVFQASGNLISDYYDYKYSVDRKESFGSSRMLVEEIFNPKEILNYGLALLAVGSIIGLLLLFKTSLNLLWIGAIGAFCTYFYYKLKYWALGDLVIFIVYGLLIALGTYLVMTHTLEWRVLLVASSAGLLIVNILHANNTRDILHDGKAHIKTLAMLLGVKNSIRQYIVLGCGAYLIVVIAVVAGILHPLSLIVFISLPLLVKNINAIRRATIDNLEIIKDMDGRSAQLVMIFSLLLALSNFVAGVL